MAPDSFDADPTSLPRAFRGYARYETEELFRRLAWEYAVLAGEHRKLKQAFEEGSSAPSQADLDQEAHVLLQVARKAARELRESARNESEQILKKARGRAAEIELQAERAGTDARAMLETAAAMRASLLQTLSQLERGEPLAHTAARPQAALGPLPPRRDASS